MKSLVAYLESQLEAGVVQVEQMAAQAGMPPVMKRAVTIMKSVHLVAQDKKGMLRLETEQIKLTEITEFLGSCMGIGMGRAALR